MRAVAVVGARMGVGLAFAVVAGGLVLVPGGCGREDAMNVPEPDAAAGITVTSQAFAEGDPIPSQYTCEGAGRVPPLAWQGVPGQAASVAVVVSDPDAPRGVFVHWVVYGLPPEDASLRGGPLPAGAREADNSAGSTGWFPPCPPQGTHRYRFTVYALREQVTARSTRQVLEEIDRLAIAQGTLTGLVSAA